MPGTCSSSVFSPSATTFAVRAAAGDRRDLAEEVVRRPSPRVPVKFAPSSCGYAGDRPSRRGRRMPSRQSRRPSRSRCPGRGLRLTVAPLRRNPSRCACSSGKRADLGRTVREPVEVHHHRRAARAASVGADGAVRRSCSAWRHSAAGRPMPGQELGQDPGRRRAPSIEAAMMRNWTSMMSARPAPAIPHQEEGRRGSRTSPRRPGRASSRGVLRWRSVRSGDGRRAR